MLRVTIGLVLIVGGCESSERHSSHVPSTSPTGTSNEFQLGVWSRSDPFHAIGIQDPESPNETLTLWGYSNPPAPSRAQHVTQWQEDLRTDAAQILDLHDVPLTEQICTQVQNLKKVKWLRLSAGVSAADLEWIGRMDQIRGLSLGRANLAGGEFGHLSSMKSLQWLSLRYATLSHEDFATLREVWKLQVLLLGGPNVNDAFLTHLAKMKLPHLTSLSLHNCSITDVGVGLICGAYDLEALELFCCGRVTSKSVDSIRRLTSLQFLEISMTGIAPQGGSRSDVQILRDALPNCLVACED